MWRGLQSHVTSYQVSNILLTIFWLCMKSWWADSSSCLTLMVGVRAKGCVHMLDKTYLPSSSCNFWEPMSNSTVHCSSPCQRRVSSIIWEFLVSAVGGFLLQPTSPPLQKDSAWFPQARFQNEWWNMMENLTFHPHHPHFPAKESFSCQCMPWFYKLICKYPMIHAECCWHKWIYLQAVGMH